MESVGDFAGTKFLHLLQNRLLQFCQCLRHRFCRVMSSEPAADAKRSALDAPDTDDDDGNLSQQQREERQAVMAAICRSSNERSPRQ